MIAAVMTASNLGARVTGWGFAVFTIGSVNWALIGFSSGQTNLLWTNGFLTIVNAIGIWRWLYRQARYQEGGQEAVEASRAADTPSLLTASGIVEMPVHDQTGHKVGHAVDALLDCQAGLLRMIVLRRGGVAGLGERLIAVSADGLSCRADRIDLALSSAQIDALPNWAPQQTPSQAFPTSREPTQSEFEC
jgi:hypothetical protein